MLNTLSRTTLFLAALVGATIFGWSFGSETTQTAGRANRAEDAHSAPLASSCLLRFQDYTTPESMAELSDEQVFGLRMQALEAYREERRWVLFMRYPNSKMLLPDDSPFGDMLWDKAFSDEANRLLTATIGNLKLIETDIAFDPDELVSAKIDIANAAKDWNEIVSSRRKLSRDILEKVYLVYPARVGSYSLDYLYTPPLPK